MKNLDRIIVLLVFVLMGTDVHSQQIIGISLSPENPTWENTITVSVGVSFATQSCFPLDTALFQSGNVFVSSACYYVGLQAQPCMHFIPFPITVPPNASGWYTFIFKLGYNSHEYLQFPLPKDPTCPYTFVSQNGDTTLVSDTLEFYVSDPLSAPEEATVEFHIVPNPSTGYVVINALQKQIREIVVTDMLGREVGRNPANGAQRLELDLSNYRAGLYLVHVVLDDGRRGVQRLVVQH